MQLNKHRKRYRDKDGGTRAETDRDMTEQSRYIDTETETETDTETETETETEEEAEAETEAELEYGGGTVTLFVIDAAVTDQCSTSRVLWPNAGLRHSAQKLDRFVPMVI